MSAEVCACGHLRARHLVRWMLPDQVRGQIEAGNSACYECECAGYNHVVTVEDSDRNNFRAKPKLPRGNCGTGHPLFLGLAKSSGPVGWESLACSDCGVLLSTPQLALVLDGGTYCGPCFLTHPEVYLGHGGEAT
ncbi:hypothetical protein SEA_PAULODIABOLI_334 [Microbacterium phage PauloDiaboli]|nr:hypothetical protein SEA_PAULODIABOLI_334 [Microbacterium phage PauloDiaboli]